MSVRHRALLAITGETRQEGSKAMSVESSKVGFAWSEKTRALVAALLVAGMMAALSLMLASSAHAARTFTVNLTADTPDANLSKVACDVNPAASGKQCTLRAAIQQANATAGADTIRFAIPGTTGVKTISPASALPVITEQVTIDGYSQPGAHPNTLAVGNDAALKIQLDGTNVGNNGFEITNSSNSVIKGLVINRFGIAGIAVGGDEGKIYIGDTSGTTDSSGNATFTLSPTTAVAAGRTITADSHNTVGDTSEFSAPMTVASS
jgi:CSLREA domain-containing protein